MPAESKGQPRFAAKAFGLCAIWLMLAGILSSCALAQSGDIKKIALLAPFEGRYRQIGYNVFYALRLAMKDGGRIDMQLLAVDDGGTVESAIKRVQALNMDPAVEAILVLGKVASHPAVQRVNDRPLIVIGSWGHDRTDEHTLYAAHPSIARQRLASDLLLLAPVSDSPGNPENLVVVSSGSLADNAFRQRYAQGDLHAPAPNLLATVTYDMGRLVLAALASGTKIAQAQHEGINGNIQFEDGYWQDAPLNSFRYDGDQLVSVSD